MGTLEHSFINEGLVMKIKISDLGPLRQAEFSLGDMTIICGGNNTGKTYATYALFGFISFWQNSFQVTIDDSHINNLFAEGVVYISLEKYVKQAPEILADSCLQYKTQLPTIFAAPTERFQKTEFNAYLNPGDIHILDQYERRISSADAERFSITKNKRNMELAVTLLVEKEKVRIPYEVIKQFISDAIKKIIFGDVFPNHFIASAERTGAAIFRNELDLPRNRLREEINQENTTLNRYEMLFKIHDDYALPIKENVKFTRSLERIAKGRSFISEQYPEILSNFADIIGGDYRVTRNDELYYVPKGQRIKLSMDESSSAVRSLLDIGFYLRYVVQQGDLLIVDEPELNLHPENQRRIARLFARLANLGVKIFITTHSDYIIKELNTLIMLNHDKPYLKQIAEREGYKAGELINANKIKVYIAEKASILLDGNTRRGQYQTLVPADIDPELGIEARSFDVTIDTMNRIQEEIVWGE